MKEISTPKIARQTAAVDAGLEAVVRRAIADLISEGVTIYSNEEVALRVLDPLGMKMSAEHRAGVLREIAVSADWVMRQMDGKSILN